MKKLLLSFFIFVFSYSFCYAQMKTGELYIGGAQTEIGYSIIQTKDGGLAIAGETESYGAGSYDVYVIKLDAAGLLQWTKTIGGAQDDEGYSIIQTNDGGYAITGWYSLGAAASLYVVKLDSAGSLSWAKTVVGPGDIYGQSIVQTYDGGYAIAGNNDGFGAGSLDVYVIKLDALGNLKWTKTIGGTGADVGNAIVQTKDNGLAIAGYTASYGAGGYDVYIIKLDSVGNMKWSKTIGGTHNDYAYSMVNTKDGGFAVTGFTYSYADTLNGDIYVLKLDSIGNLKWTKTIGGPQVEEGYSIIQANDGGYAVAGRTSSYGFGSYDFYVIKLDSTGTVKWTKTFGGTSYDWGYSIVQTKDKGYAITGGTNSYGTNVDVYIVKIDSLGRFCGSSDSGGIVSSGGTITSSGNGILKSGGVEGTGDSVNTGGTYHSICNLAAVENIKNADEIVSIFPNPSNGIFELRINNYELGINKTVEVYNMLGEKIFQQFSILNSPFSINLIAQPAGIYLYRVISNDGTLIGTGKLVIQ